MRALRIADNPLFSIAFLVVAVAVSGCSLAGDITPPPNAVLLIAEPEIKPQPILAPVAQPSAAAGALLFAENCTRCHGSSGAGDGEFAGEIDTSLPDFTDGRLAELRTPAEWFEIITNGRIETFMPPWEQALNLTERWDLVAFLYTLSTSEASTQVGAEIYQLRCAACHGLAGLGDGPQAATLITMMPDFTDSALMIERTNAAFVEAVRAGMGEAMPAFAEALTEAEIQSAADYVRTLWFEPSEGTAVVAEAKSGVERELPSLGAGSVNGTLFNQTTGAAVSEPTEVTLHVFDSFQIAATYTTTTDMAGNFAFENLIFAPGNSVVTTANHDSVLYNSDILPIEEASAALQMDIPVFKATTDVSVLQIEQLHVIIQDAASSLQITEVVVFVNNGDKTLIPAAEGALTFELPLPADATNLQFDESTSGAVERTTAGLGYMRPVYPSTEAGQFIFSFLLPYDGSLTFDQLATFPIGETNIVLPEGNLRLVAADFVSQEPRDFGDGLRIVPHSGPALASGDSLRFELRGYTESAGLSTFVQGSTTRDLLIGFGALAVVLAVWARLWLGGQSASVPPQQAVQQRDELLRSIAELDTTKAQGALAKADYQRQRAKLKQTLIDLIHAHRLDI